MKFFKKLINIFRLAGESKPALSEKVIALEAKVFVLEAMLKEQTLILSQVAKVQAELSSEFSYILEAIQITTSGAMGENYQIFSLPAEDDDFIN